MKEKRYGISALFMYAILILTLLAMVTVGAKTYAVLTKRRTYQSQLRAVQTYVQTKIQSADAAGGVSIQDGPEGDSIVLRVAGTNYQTSIYCQNGYLLEQTVLSGTALDPQNAQKIAECSQISFDWKTPQLLEIICPYGSSMVYLRSVQEGI